MGRFPVCGCSTWVGPFSTTLLGIGVVGAGSGGLVALWVSVNGRLFLKGRICELYEVPHIVVIHRRNVRG